MAKAWPCPLCKRDITGSRAKAAHYKNLWKKASDPTRCDNVAFVVPLIPTPVIEYCDETSDTAPAAACCPPVGLITTATSSSALFHLARKPFKDIQTARHERKEYTIPNASLHARSDTYNMLRTQNAWDRYYRLAIMGLFGLNYRFTYRLFCLAFAGTTKASSKCAHQNFGLFSCHSIGSRREQ